jgi:hypothetical protein
MAVPRRLGEPSGGVAYVGSLNWSTPEPAFVFSSNLGNWQKAVWEAVSHRAANAECRCSDRPSAQQNKSSFQY